jgi:pimeloyl-ACP methyl ester carboxylesterase
MPNVIRIEFGPLCLSDPVRPQWPLWDSFEEDGERALNALVMDCASNAACSKAFPLLAPDLQKLRDQRDSFFVFGLQLLQYSSATSRFIPLLVSETAAGRREPLERAITQTRDRFVSQLSIGLHLSVMCSEEWQPGIEVPAGRRSVLRAEYDTACSNWPLADVPPDFRMPTRIDRPALIVAGEWDPVTSPRWAQMADQFSRTQLVLVPKGGHVFDGAMIACIGRMTAEFLARGNTNAACAQRNNRPAYAFPLS